MFSFSLDNPVTDNENDILIRKSSRILRLRKTVNKITDDDNDDDDETYMNDDEEFIVDECDNNENNDDDHQNKSLTTKKRRSAKSSNDDDGEDDDDDEFRPLKKRRIVRRNKQVAGNKMTATTTSANINANSTSTSASETNRIQKIRLAKNREIERLQMILYKCYKHQSLLNQLNQLLMKMNGCLVDKIHTMISGDGNGNNEESPPITSESLMTLIRSKQNNLLVDNFIAQYDPLITQYNQLNDERKQMLAKIDDENVEQSQVDQTIGSYLRKPKKKFTMFDLIAVDSSDRPDKSVMNNSEKKKRSTSTTTGGSRVYNKKAKSSSTRTAEISNETHKTTTTSTSRSKRLKRKTKMKYPQQEEDSSEMVENSNGKYPSYHPCPWPNCTYESKREWALNEHINLTHTGLKNFGCKVDQCPMMFFSSSELDNHMKKYHAEVASKEFMPCTWPGCNALFKSKLGLRAHVQVHKGENLIQCDWPGCNYTAKNKRQHENHLRKHTGDRPFSCDFPGCESKFRTNDSLRHHKKSHSEYRPFRCDWPGCEANFKTNRGLTIHRALHTGEKLFKCDWPDCEFASERKYHVDLHIYENHTHVKPYPCSWIGCDASFLRNDKLQNHLKIHRQEKPFKCIHPTCEKHFVEKGNMMKHFNNVHKR